MPATLRVATPCADNVEDPSDVAPSRNITVPVGAALPVAAFTVAVSVVEALCARLAGLAVSVVVVAVSGAVTVTVTAAETDAAKFMMPA